MVAAIAAIVTAFVLYFGAARLAGSRAGKLALLLGVVVLPFVAVVNGAGYAYETSSSTEFCLDCHEMDGHGKSLFLDDPLVLPAMHYQKRLIDRDHACFQCHTNYAMFGDLRAKANGLRHVWVHYLGEASDPLELYDPYPSSNCLHCHDDARSYLEASGHQAELEAISAGEKSCLECHSSGHALPQLEEGSFWIPE